MGAIISAPVSFVTSCFGSIFGQFLCSCCPKMDGPIGTRIAYALMLMFTAILQTISMVPSVASFLVRIPRICPNNITTESCQLMAGYLSSYKIGFSYFLFSLLMTILSIGIKSKQSIRAKFHNSVHGIKLLMLSAFIIAGYATPTTNGLLVFMRLAGFSGGLIFIVIQLICVVDFAHLLNESWLERIEAGGSQLWMFAQAIISFGSIIGSVIIYTLILIYYGHLTLHIVIVTINIGLSIIGTVVSILPIVREYQPTSGILQSSLVSVYVSYLTWTAISSDPNSNFSFGSGLSSNVILATSLVLFILSVVYSVFSITITKRVHGTSDKDLGDGIVVDDDQPEYSYHTLHILLALASLYVTMTLTSWLKSTSDIHAFVQNQGAVWIKASSSVICWFIYIWTCVAPCILTSREFH
ncbi:hypothetical protein GJ496_006171 [Pomphorhynchus laevis]|nr:hypothetical protein GJ496_006171 [Pomphorhynchus laevis]